MKPYILLFFFATLGNLEIINAQVVKINNALSLNWSNNGARKIFKYNPCVGFEYLENKYFVLSSSIGFNNKAQKYPIYNNENILETNIRYLELSTTARFKISTKDTSFFVGVGPAIGWKRKSEYKTYGKKRENVADAGEFRAREKVVDLIMEIGAYQDFNRYRIEAFASYNNNMTKIIPESRKGFIGHTLAFNISLGYKL